MFPPAFLILQPLSGNLEKNLDGLFPSLLRSIFPLRCSRVPLPRPHSIFLTTRGEGIHVKQSAKSPTNFQQAMAELGIALIYAHSPEARDRIERAFRTFQDRLLKELKLKDIKDPEEAHQYLNDIFIPRYQKRFGVEPENREAAWRKTPANLKEILSKRLRRKVKRDFTISEGGKILQLRPKRLNIRLSGIKVEVRQCFDGSFRVYHSSGEEIPCKRSDATKRPKKKIKFKIIRRTWQGVTFCRCN